MAIWVPPFVGADVPDWMTFAVRVAWYAAWIQYWPMSNIHFKFPHLGETAGFILEAHLPRSIEL